MVKEYCFSKEWDKAIKTVKLPKYKFKVVGYKKKWESKLLSYKKAISEIEKCNKNKPEWDWRIERIEVK